MNWHQCSHCLFIRHTVHFRRMYTCRTILRASRFVALAAALMLASCSRADKPSSENDNGNGAPARTGPPSIPPGQSKSKKPNPPGVTGRYHVLVRGDYIGDGNASMSPAALQIDANVKDAAGNPGTLHVSLPVSGGHFAGTGTVMGHSMNIEGRVDAADVKGTERRPVLQIARLVSTFSSSDGHYARIVGGHD